uniref:phospholipase D family protein n=1 Tax=Algoriphagus sp. TaxID=1872435 RepID=UPI00258DCFEC|nr:phospholipase D family protein [Algoriphagus sp.]
MTQIIQQLGPELKKSLKEAEEVWVAVALMNETGLQEIESSIPDSAKVTYILGIHLPTHPRVLKQLSQQELISEQIRLFLYRKTVYHPKVYLIKRKDGFTCFIGSGNATDGGFRSNIEMGVKLETPDGGEVLGLINNYIKDSIKVTKTFLEKYTKAFEERKKAEKANKKLTEKAIKLAVEDYEAISESRNEFIKDLKAFKRKKQYEERVNGRKKALESLRKTLDYPHFQDVRLEEFFKIEEMGHLLEIPKPSILADLDKFKLMLNYLNDRNTDLAEKYDMAHSGALKMAGISYAMISKILMIFDPVHCWVENKKSKSTLEYYGLQLPKGMTPGQKYKAKALFLKGVCEEAGIPDMTILDAFLYDNAE